ncbi:hypothetical protein [Curtobacterium sp. MCPF17_052]|uniref:hypothetical protein n=1 Tax=Curtobacterium sp. MCPF17_052 TaxID=2175655 RepID=UPI0024E01ABE|nr:hypothetical protein [Curtobacterium sp. MCPF17_052]WIB11506.1 hypothetical protein DEJ36_10965 [Curtobacterium sp. MCPF17_052]
MKDIHYAGRAIRTTNGAADAVIRYAAVLGANRKTDTVDVPTVDERGRPSIETLLLGPASQITVGPAADDAREGSVDDAGGRRRGCRRRGLHRAGASAGGAGRAGPAGARGPGPAR